MQISLNWLNDYINLQGLSAVDIAKTLTDLGLEVESIVDKAAFSEEVVVGKILTAVAHPNADSLRLCTVDVGDGQPLSIVCGAANARAGIFVAVAKIGAVLPGDFKIKKSKIRGETSYGMLCSGKELGISEDADGIIEIQDSPVIGTGVGKHMGLSDTVLTLNVTPNRGDCLSYVGIARDLGARLKKPLKEPEVTGQATPGVATLGKVKVSIETEKCSRFVALHVKNVTAELSPAWLQKRIETSGMRPINLLVDATNYVMLEYGQPVHAYDVRDINGALLSVRTALGGEELVTLDGQKRQLVEGDLLICDAKGPIGLAGVMGGQTTEVKADTKEIIIEVAAFSPLAVRKTARRLSLHSEASKRFERGINIDNLPKVAHRVAEIIANASGGQAEIAHDHIDEYSDQVSKRVVTLRLTRVRDVLGTPHLTGREVEDVLTSLEFEKLDSNLDRYVFEIPFWRNDIDREIDLIEEVARIRGYEKITSTLPVMSIKTVQEDPFIEFAEDVRVVMASSGFNETITFPFLSLNEISHMGVLAGHPLFPSLSLANPISEEHRYLHTTLLPGLLRALVGNRRQGVHGARLFECGRAYFNGDSEPVDAARYPNLKNLLRHGRHLTRRAKTEEKRPHERHVLAGIMDQPFTPKNWDTPLTFAGFFHGKAAAEGLMKAIAVGNSQFQHINPVELPFLHPGAAAQIIVNGKWAGFVGELHPKTAAAFNLAAASTETATTAPVVFELDLELLFNSRSLSKTFDPLQTRFPPISRDFAFLIDAEKTHQDVAEAIRGFKSKKYLSHYKLFDIYTGDKLPSGKKSMAYSFEFQAERTLTEKDVEPEIEALMSWLGEKLGLTQRK